MKTGLARVIVFLLLPCSLLAHPDHYHVTYGKYTHIQTAGPVVYKVLGNNSWRVEASPQNDGVFVWSKRNSIPTNIKLYTESHSYNVDLSPSSQEHDEFIQPTGMLLTAQSGERVIIPADIDQLKQKAEVMISASSTDSQPAPVVENKPSINVVYTKENAPEKIVEIPAVAITDVDKTNEVIVLEAKQPRQTVRAVLSEYMKSQDFTLVEMTHDARKLDIPSSMPSITSWNDLHQASDGLINAVYVDKDRRQIRVK